LTVNETQRRELVLEIQRLAKEEGLTNTQIKNLLGIGYRRVRESLAGDADKLCRDGRASIVRTSSVSGFHGIISEMANEKTPYKDIYLKIQGLGFKGSYSNLAAFCSKHFDKNKKKVPNSLEFHYINRNAVLSHVWTGDPMETYDKQFIFTVYPALFELKDIVLKFRQVLNGKDPGWIAEFIETATKSSFASIVSLGNGMKRDIDAIKNSILYTMTNAVLEGNINRLKMIKRTMYGRAGYDLLRAKVLGGGLAVVKS
jgi:hypothetical protein